MHATEYLNQPGAGDVPGVVVLSGPERFLKQETLQLVFRQIFPGEESPAELATQLEGREADWRAIQDELKTVSMFAGKRCVVLLAADDFVKDHRPALEAYAHQPARKSVLILDVKSWPKTTKLAKIVASTGLTVECTELKGAQLIGWAISHASQRYEKTLARPAAQLLIELAGTSIGQLDCELDKLASFVGDRKSISREDIPAVVGGWRLETTWAMINAVRDGQLGVALTEMNKLLTAGEAPQKLLGGISFVYRRITQAVRLSATGKPLPAALKEAGVFPNEIAATVTYLRKMGRQRAEQIPQLLLTADLGMKGDSSLPPRILLERLLVQLSPPT